MAISNIYALLDKNFLLELDQNHNKEIFVKIISLNWDEESIAEITGNVTGGSISVDGSSKVRRTCNITLTTSNIQIDEISWSLNTKFSVEIGLRNTINPKYEDIIWFPQGLYIITTFSSTLNGQGYTVNIQGKDKMCLLNGDISGALFAAHEFSTIYQTSNDGSIKKELIPIYEIIREAVHQYAQEPYKNIVINDLDTCGVELLDYVAKDANLYIFDQYIIDENTPEADGISYEYRGSGANITSIRRNTVPVFNDVATTQILFGSSTDTRALIFDAAIQDQGVSYNLFPFVYNGIWYVLHKRVNPKEDINTTAGYRATDLTYNGDLMVAVGGNITEMLDKIVQMLGEFEYYYDINGRFIFQRKKIYFNSNWTNAVVNDNETYYDNVNTSKTVYDFLQGYLIESISDKPTLASIKNDFSVWGELTGVQGTKLPIHLRYAIDRKPQIYYSLLEGKPYVSNLIDGGSYDWRELIYQMARDNLASNTVIKGLTLALSSQNTGGNPFYHYDYTLLNRSEYSNYYLYDASIKNFRVLANEQEYDICKLNHTFLYGHDSSKVKLQLTNAQLEEMNDKLGYDYLMASLNMIEVERNIVKETELLSQYRSRNYVEITHSELDAWQDTFNTGYDAYFIDMLEFWPHLYRTQNTVKMVYNEDGSVNVNEDGTLIQTDNEVDNFNDWIANNYWNPDYITYKSNNIQYDSDTQTYKRVGDITFKEPEKLFFWLDFFDQEDSSANLYEFSVEAIGRRTKAVNDKDVKAIYFRETPSLLFVSEDYPPVQGEKNLAYARINIVPPYTEYFRISRQGKSAKEVLDTMLYENTYYQNTITISTIPIYYLEPNNRIAIHDSQIGISGEYLIKNYNISLNFDGMMSITANKAVDKII